MNAPYWGVFPPSKARKDSVTNDERERFVAFDREHFPSSASIALKSKPDRFSIQSEKSEAPSISTISVTPSELLGGGLAPRPPSFPYGSTGYDRNFIEKRRQRRKREQDRISGEITTPTASGIPDGPSNLYNPTHLNNDRSPVFHGSVRSSFLKRADSATSPVDQNPYTSGERFQSKLPKRLQRERFHIDTAIPIGGDEIQQFEYAPDRSPLQRLEMALGSMSKKEIRSPSEDINFSVKGIENVQNTGKSVDGFESQIGRRVRTNTVLESGDIKESEKNGVSTLGPRNDVDNSNEYLGNNKNHKSEQRQTLNELFSKKGSDSDVEKSRSKTQSSIPKSTSTGYTSLSANKKSPKSSRFEGETEIQGLNGRSHKILGVNVQSPKSNNLTPKLSQKSDFHSNQYSPQEKDVSILPDNSTIKPHNSEINVLSDANAKPSRRGTLNKLSRLAIDRFSTKVIKDKIKSPREKEKFHVETNKNTLLNSQSVENTKSPIIPSTEYLEHCSLDKRFRENKKLPKQDVYISSRRLDEWKNGGVAQLSGANLDLDTEIHNSNGEKDRNRWESKKTGPKRYSNSHRRAEAYDGEYDDTTVASFLPRTRKLINVIRKIRIYTGVAPTRFKPPLFLNCGPILRYCGLRREVPRHRHSSTKQEREIWRGTVMIVCKDSHSSYELAPTLRLFCQPIDLLPPPPARIDGSELASEYIDPIAGLPRIGRDGRTLYVRPIEQIDVEKDLSREESAIGLYEMNRTNPNDLIDTRQNPHKLKYDGEKAGKYKEVRGFRLHSEQGMTFWRFNLEIELRENQQRIAYRINRGPASGFWVPPRGQAMNIIYHSSNSFSRGVNPDQFCGPDPMWRDILNTHQTQPFHVMIGGGNQICNDDVTHVSPLFKAWLDMHQSLKERHIFSSELQQELEAFYLNRYCMWFSQGLFGLAVSQIPSVNIFADHDIIDGFGSHSDQYMCSSVISGLGAVAFKYYMLFQHQSSIDEGEDTESSWILGVRPGPYIKELSRTIFTRLGRTVAFLGLDCRTERTSEEVISLETTQKIFKRLMKEIVRGDTRHLLVLMAVPDFNLQSGLSDKRNSKIFQPIKSLGRKGSLKKRISNGREQIQDEFDEKRTMCNMRDERIRLIQALQDLAFAKSIRITILGGDVKLGAVGLLYSNRKLRIPKDHDFRYMPTVFSSAIVDAPVPDQVTDLLDKKSKVRHIDAETNEDTIPIFTHDVDNILRNSQRLLNRRNWCSIRQYNFSNDQPSQYLENLTTLAPQRSRSLIRRLSGSSSSRKSPKFISSTFENRGKLDTSRPPLSNPKFFNDGDGNEILGTTSLSLQSSPSFDKRKIIGRTLSLTRKDFNPVEIFRRSSRRRSHSGELNRKEGYIEGNVTNEIESRNSSREPEIKDLYEIPTRSKPINIAQEKSKVTGEIHSPEHRNDMSNFEESINQSFESTKLSLKQTQKNKNQPKINLDGSLDICLNMEINPKDPAGATMPYRLIVPALSCNEAIYFFDV